MKLIQLLLISLFTINGLFGQTPKGKKANPILNNNKELPIPANRKRIVPNNRLKIEIKKPLRIKKNDSKTLRSKRWNSLSFSPLYNLA